MDNNSTVEVWTNIKGKWEGIYQVSNLGRVRSLGNDRSRKLKILKQTKHNKGFTISLCKDCNKERFEVDYLVISSFKPCSNMEQLKIIHRDGNVFNNSIDNLEWCKEEVYLKRLEETNIKNFKIYCTELDRVFNSLSEASEELGLNTGNLSSCLKGRANHSYCGRHPVTGEKLHWVYVVE